MLVRRLAALLVVFIVLLLLLTSGSAIAQDTSGSGDITIFRDNDSLTIYIPPTKNVSLSGIQFQVDNAAGEISTYRIDQYPAFIGLPFAALGAPVCLRLVRNNSDVVAPIECQGLGQHFLTQSLADADVFWFNKSAEQGYLVSVLRYDTRVDWCPADRPKCSIVLPPALPTVVATNAATNTPLPTAVSPMPTDATTTLVDLGGQWAGTSRDTYPSGAQVSYVTYLSLTQTGNFITGAIGFKCNPPGCPNPKGINFTPVQAVYLQNISGTVSNDGSLIMQFNDIIASEPSGYWSAPTPQCSVPSVTFHYNAADGTLAAAVQFSCGNSVRVIALKKQ